VSGFPAGRVAPAGSMSELIEALLAETPRVRDAARQQALTEHFLTPALAGLEALLLGLRAELDPGLRQARPGAGDKPYPLGQCLGITRAVQRRLARLDPGALPGLAAEGYGALRRFLSAGGEMRRAWGDLRGQYFQNALIVGALYVDVSNDTVVVTKPKVEILPFAEAGFAPIADYGHYARIAGRYWKHQILPNHVLPELAPYLPLIQIAPDGRVSLGSSTPSMLGLTLGRGFAPSEEALGAPAMPDAAFAALGAALRGGPTAVAANPQAGRAAALGWCRRYRDQAWAEGAAAFARTLAAGAEANGRLSRHEGLAAAAQAA
jgi:hypothetical protein